MLGDRRELHEIELRIIFASVIRTIKTKTQPTMGKSDEPTVSRLAVVAPVGCEESNKFDEGDKLSCVGRNIVVGHQALDAVLVGD